MHTALEGTRRKLHQLAEEPSLLQKFRQERKLVLPIYVSLNDMHDMSDQELYRSGWRISETQEPQCLCLTPLNLCIFCMAMATLCFAVSLVPDRCSLCWCWWTLPQSHLIARDASGAGRLYTAPRPRGRVRVACKAASIYARDR